MPFLTGDQGAGQTELVRQLVDWVGTKTWDESRDFLTEHAASLLVDEAEAALQQLIEDNPTEQVLPVHLAILQSARDGGIDEAYQALEESLQFRALAELLVSWAGTQSWDDARAFFEQHIDDLMTDEAEAVLALLVIDNPAQPDLLAHQGLLTLSRVDGPDRAYGLVADPERLRALTMSIAGQRDRHRGVPRSRLLSGLYPDDGEAQFSLAMAALWADDRDEAGRAIGRCAAVASPAERAGFAQRLAEMADTEPDLAPALAMLRGALA